LGVVNQTTNTPPTSPTDGDAYIIGTSPTGVWSGNARKIAIYETSAWVIYTPQDGWMVFDKAQFASFTYYSGVWNSLASGIASEKLYTAVGSTALTRTNATATSFAGDTSTTAPTTARVYFDSSISITHQCGSNKTLEFSFTSGGQFVSGTGLAYGFTIGLHVDSSATATDWAYQPAINLTSSTATPYVSSVVLKHVTADTSSHTYKLIFYPYHTSSGTSATFTTVWNLYTPRLVMRQLA
jgi:hypothetical protein